MSPLSAHREMIYDVVVLGAGAVGENVADRAGRTGLSVAVIEDALVGGECSYWACMPSKALLRPGAALSQAQAVKGSKDAVTGTVDVAAALERRDSFASHWDDSGQVTWLDKAGISLVRGHASFTGERTVLVTSSDRPPVIVTARHAVVVTTGSTPVLPDIEGLSESAPWTSKDATATEEVPERLAIIGGGVVGCEMATAFRDLGSEVTVLVRDERLLTFAEPFAGEAVAASLTSLGVDVRFGVEARKVRRDADGVHISLTDGSQVTADQLLVATGRKPATELIGLETIGLDPGQVLTVSDTLEVSQVGGGWLFAAGDVTDRSTTTHQGKYQARIAGDVIATRFGKPARASNSVGSQAWSEYTASADHEAQTQVVFTRPEVASVGLTERAAIDAGYDIRIQTQDLGAVAGAALFADDYAGTAQIVIDTRHNVILGATFVGPAVAELLHAATIAIVARVPLNRLWHAVPAYPTISEVWLRLLENAGL